MEDTEVKKTARINVSSVSSKPDSNSDYIDIKMFHFNFEDFMFLLDYSKYSKIIELKKALLARIKEGNPFPDIFNCVNELKAIVPKDTNDDGTDNCRDVVCTNYGLSYLCAPMCGQKKVIVEKNIIFDLKHRDQLNIFNCNGCLYYETCNLYISGYIIPSTESCSIIQTGDCIQLQKVFIEKIPADDVILKFSLSHMVKEHHASNIKSRGTVKRALSSSIDCMSEIKRRHVEDSGSEKALDAKSVLGIPLSSKRVIVEHGSKPTEQSSNDNKISDKGYAITKDIVVISPDSQKETVQKMKACKQVSKKSASESSYKREKSNETAGKNSDEIQEASRLVNYLDTPQIQSLMKDKLAQFENKNENESVQIVSLFDEKSDNSTEKLDVIDSSTTKPEKRKRNRRKHKKKNSENDKKATIDTEKTPQNYTLNLPRSQMPTNKRFLFNNSDEEEVCDVKPIPETNNKTLEKGDKNIISISPFTNVTESKINYMVKDKSYSNSSPSLNEEMSNIIPFNEPKSSVLSKAQNIVKPVKPKIREKDFWKNDRRSMAGFLENMRSSYSDQKESPESPITNGNNNNVKALPPKDKKINSSLKKEWPDKDISHKHVGHSQVKKEILLESPINSRNKTVEFSSSSLGACMDPGAKFAELMTKQRLRNNRKDHSKNEVECKLESEVTSHQEAVVAPTPKVAPDSQHLHHNPPAPNGTKLNIEALTQDQIEALLPFKGTPTVGDLIAFKMMEMDESFCPGLSAFKIGAVASYIDGVISIELRPEYRNSAPKTGRFVMEWDGENDDESSFVESPFSALHDVRNVSS